MTFEELPRAIAHIDEVEQKLDALRADFQQAGIIKVFHMQEAAELLRISPNTLLELIRSKQIRAYHATPKSARWLITAAAILDYISERENAYE